MARPRGLRLDTVFRLEETRTVSNDWVVRYANRHFQLERQSGLAPARSTVVVCESVDGRLEIRYRDRAMRWTEIVAGVARPRPRAPRRSRSPARRRHAWPACRSIIRGGTASKRWALMGPTGRCRIDEAPVDAAGAVDAQNAPTAPWKTRRRVSHSAHRHPRTGGDISNELTMGTFLTSFDIFFLLPSGSYSYSSGRTFFQVLIKHTYINKGRPTLLPHSISFFWFGPDYPNRRQT